VLARCCAWMLGAYMYIKCTNTNIRTSLDVHRTRSMIMRPNLINPSPTARAAQEPISDDINRGSE
jgi:hypothetical protein